jgi:hypothetical protein
LVQPVSPQVSASRKRIDRLCPADGASSYDEEARLTTSAASSDLTHGGRGIKDEQRWIAPVVAVTHCMTTTRKWPAELRLNPNATSSLIERLGRDVLSQHPEVEGSTGANSGVPSCRLREKA